MQKKDTPLCKNPDSVTEERHRWILENALDAVVITDADHVIIYTNRQAQSLLGYGDAELLHTDILNIVVPEKREELRSTFDTLKLEGRFRSETLLVHRFGTFIPVEINAMCLPDGSCFGTFRDVTRRHEGLAKLADSEKRYRMLFENSRDALMQNSPPDWKFSSVNRAALQLFGIENKAQFLNLSPWDISPEFQPDGIRSAEKAKQMLKTALRKGHHFFEWTHKRLDGTVFPAAVLLTKMELNEETFVLGSVRDISDRKRLEKMIQEHRNEMDLLQKQQVASHTAAAIAHELNQPLMAISTFSEAALMLLGAQQPNLVEIRSAIESCKQQALRAGQSIHELLHLLNLQSVSAEPFDLNKEIMNILAIAKTDRELKFHWELRLDESLPPVLANRIHLHKVLLNLLQNGIEAMEAAGVPKPAITVTVRTKQDGCGAQVTIRDKGPGIKPELVKRLFEPFFTTKATGIGMGLVISRALIEANGGQLWVDPDEKPGATFHLTLPFAT